jgi:bacterioferritin
LNQAVGDEERHYDNYDVEMGNMKKFGIDYLALQSIERIKTRAQIAATSRRV